MLHERTAPLVAHDAVAVRDESDTLVLYAERLTASQRAELRPYLLEALEQEEGAAAVVVVPAGATRRVLASPPHTVAPLGVVGALVATLAVVLIAAAFVAAVIVLVVDEVQVTDRGDSGRPPRTLAAADRDPEGEGIVARDEMTGEPPPPPPSRLPREEALSVPEGRRPEVGLLVDVPGTVRRIVPDAVAVVTSVVPGDVVDDVAADALESPSPIDLPELRLSDVEVPDVEPPVDLPDVDLSGVSLDVSDETGEDGKETEGTADDDEDDRGDEDDEELGDADDAVPDLGSDEDDDE